MSDTLALISDARRALAEAQTLPDIRRVMEAAGAAENIAKRQAKLAQGQEMAADVVRAAEDAANDAAVIRIEAQAKAGEMLRSMERAGPGGDGRNQHRGSSQPATTLGDLGVTKSDSSRWQRIAEIPQPVRQEYVEQAKAAPGGEVTTAGLLRHAEERAADRWAETAPVPAENRYRLELSRLAEQAGKVVEFDPEDAARIADEGTALSLETVPGTWAEWVRRFQRARNGLHVVEGS